MNFFGFNVISAAWLFALAAPLILLYFLKLKRPRVVVPSLALWRQVMADHRVNSPFQKFKRNLLLLLQLLLLIALALAAMQPFWRGDASRVKRLPILIDCSASMAALDKEGGRSGIELAREEAGRRIDALMPGQEICLITFGKAARKRIGFTDDKAALRGALAEARVEDVGGDLEDALRLAQSLGQSEPFDEVLLLSDGNVPVRTRFDLPFKLNYHRIEAGGSNVGIVELNARRTVEGEWEIFASVETSDDKSGPVGVVLERDGEEIARRTLSPAPGRPEQILFTMPGDPGRVDVIVTTDSFDSLKADNTASILLPSARPLLVYCPTALAAFRHAIEGIPAVDVYPRGNITPPSSYDLLITDQAADLSRSAGMSLAVGVLPEDAAKFVTLDRSGTEIIDWQQDHPLLQHVQLGDVLFLDRPAYTAQGREAELDALGYRVPMHGTSGPMMLERTAAERLEYYLLFHPDRSTLPFRVGFPIFVSNAASVALERAGIARIEAVRTGVLPPRPWVASEAVDIKGPGGEKQTVQAGNGQISGIVASAAGTYEISGPSGNAEFIANILDRQETGLQFADQIQFSEELQVAATAVTARTDRPLWRWIAAAGFVLLLAEWWYFQRRPFAAA